MNIHISLYVTDDETKEKALFDISPNVITGYETCAWSQTGKHAIIRLLFDSYHEWIINMTDRTAVHIISNRADGIVRKSYTFEKLIIN